MRSLGKKNVNEYHYAEMLVKTPSKITEFVDLFDEYLNQPGEDQNYKMILLLMKGFKLRVVVLTDPTQT